MFSVKTIEPKKPSRKKSITISGVSIKDNTLVDEDGSIVSKLAEEMGNEEFTIKITIPLPDED